MKAYITSAGPCATWPSPLAPPSRRNPELPDVSSRGNVLSIFQHAPGYRCDSVHGQKHARGARGWLVVFVRGVLVGMSWGPREPAFLLAQDGMVGATGWWGDLKMEPRSPKVS